jgi:hypothetical protein
MSGKLTLDQICNTPKKTKGKKMNTFREYLEENKGTNEAIMRGDNVHFMGDKTSKYYGKAGVVMSAGKGKAMVKFVSGHQEEYMVKDLELMPSYD